jgi:RNA polymerase sigma-70 factor (ECF subfamily)
MDEETGALPATDMELARRARQGDDQAFHELVDRHAAHVYRLALALVGNAADAEDVVQEALSGALRSLRSFEGRSSVKTWLSSIVVRQAAKWHRTQARHRVVRLDELEEGAVRPGSSLEAGDAADRSLVRLDVLAVLQTVSREHREVLVLREMEGRSYGEIAEILAIPRGTVESRLHRARQELRNRLKGYLP